MTLKKKYELILLRSVYILFGIVVSLIIARNFAVLPSVMDEVTYASNIRFFNYRAAVVPDFIYRLIYQPINYCGSGWLYCAKLINTVCFGAGVFFVYKTSMLFANRYVSVYVAALVLLSALNIYTSFVMPESAYFMVFWIFVFFYIRSFSRDSNFNLLVSSLFYGCLALIKPHAIFFLPSIILTLFVINAVSESNNDRPKDQFIVGLKSAIKFVSLFLLVKFGIGYLLGGESAFTILGSAYNKLANQTNLGAQPILLMVKRCIRQIGMHGVYFTVAFLFPAIYACCKIFSKRVVLLDRSVFGLILFSLLVTINMIFVTAIFSAKMSFVSPSDELRMHTRYYSFILPLYYIIASLAVKDFNEYKNKIATCFGFVLFALLIYFQIKYGATLGATPDYVDGSDYFGLAFDVRKLIAVEAISVLAFALLIYTPNFGSKLYFYIALPLLVLTAAFYSNNRLLYRIWDSPFDRAISFLNASVPANDFKDVYYISYPDALGVHVLSKINASSNSINYITLDQGEDLAKVVDVYKPRYILYVGNYKFKNDIYSCSSGQGFNFCFKN